MKIPELQPLRRALADWFLVNARAMPWRTHPEPWRVWVSEIMLQQTRVESVIGYFERFMRRFPTPVHVADAPIDELLSMWAGLGYYARARNLREACISIRDEFHGQVPDDPHTFGGLKGVGRYTQGAVMSIAFGLAEPIVDGNVIRVFSRLFEIEENASSATALKLHWQLAEAWVAELGPEESPSVLNQSLMELGALVCKPRNPDCHLCPLQEACGAFATKRTHELPKKKPRVARPTFQFQALVSVDECGRIAVHQRDVKGLLAGLWALPMVSLSSKKKETSRASVHVKHAFTHQVWQVDVVACDVDDERIRNGDFKLVYKTIDELGRLALGGPSLKALLAFGVKLPKRRGAGR